MNSRSWRNVHILYQPNAVNWFSGKGIEKIVMECRRRVKLSCWALSVTQESQVANKYYPSYLKRSHY